MPGRTHQRKAIALGGWIPPAGRQQRRLERRLRGERVAVEPGRLVDVAYPLDELLGMTPQDRLDRRRLDLLVLERLEQHGKPLLRVGMVRRRVQARERRMAQDVDRRTASARSSSEAPFCARPTR